MKHSFIALGVGLVLILVWVFNATEARVGEAWAEMTELVDEIQESIDLADATRPVLHGVALDGNAHLDYQRALGLLSPEAEADWIAWSVSSGVGEDSEAAALRDKLVDENQAMLAAVSTGARRGEARYLVDWESGLSYRVPQYTSLRNLSTIVILAAQRDLDEGREARAVERFLDGVQVGRDFIDTPLMFISMSGCGLLDISLSDPLVELSHPGSLSRPSLERLAHGLLAVDESFPMPVDAYPGEIIRLVKGIHWPENFLGGGQPWSDLRLKSWQYGFSLRYMAAKHVGEVTEWNEALRETEGSSWPKRGVAVGLREQAMRESSNPLSQLQTSLLKVEEAVYERLTRLRLVRTAIEFRLTGHAPSLEDPFGERLMISDVPEGLRIASCGPGGDFTSSEQVLVIPR